MKTLTTIEKTARKLTKAIFDDLKAKSEKHEVSVGTMQMRLQLANIQQFDSGIQFTHYFNASRYPRSLWQSSVRLWYNRPYTRNEIYHSIIMELERRSDEEMALK